MQPSDALAQIEAELRAATPGPWYFATDKPHDNPLIGNYTQLCSLADEVDEYEADILSADDCADLFVAEPNAALIAHCPTYLAALVKVAEVANAEHDALVAWLEALGFSLDNLVATDSGDNLNACMVHFRRTLAALTKAVEP